MSGKILWLFSAALCLASCDQSDDAKGGDQIAKANSAKDGEQVANKSGSERKPVDEVDWGTDDGDFANDGECDDPRFEGYAMTDTGLLVEDIKKDATDCKAAYEQGALELK